MEFASTGAGYEKFWQLAKRVLKIHSRDDNINCRIHDLSKRVQGTNIERLRKVFPLRRHQRFLIFLVGSMNSPAHGAKCFALSFPVFLLILEGPKFKEPARFPDCVFE